MTYFFTQDNPGVSNRGWAPIQHRRPTSAPTLIQLGEETAARWASLKMVAIRKAAAMTTRYLGRTTAFIRRPPSNLFELKKLPYSTKRMHGIPSRTLMG